MKNMIRTHVVICLLVCMMLVLCACNPPRYAGEDPAFYVIVVANAPLCTGVNMKSKLIETDSFGRRLFTYNSGEKVLVGIAQKTGADVVGYYEDFCCVYKDIPESFQSEKIEAVNANELLMHFTSEEIESFKKINDWDEPIDDSKITNRRFPMDDEVAEYLFKNLSKAEMYLVREIEHEEDINYEIKQIDFDQNGKALYFAYVFKKNDADYKRVFYLILTENHVKEVECSIEEMNNLYTYQSQLHSFKMDNGWVFG